MVIRPVCEELFGDGLAELETVLDGGDEIDVFPGTIAQLPKAL